MEHHFAGAGCYLAAVETALLHWDYAADVERSETAAYVVGIYVDGVLIWLD